MSGASRMMGRFWPTGKIEGPTPREAWRALIADPTDENRAIFVAACERAR